MPRQMPGANVVTQTRTFNYVVGTSIQGYLQSATNPENGTVSHTHNVGTLSTKTDAKGQTLKYAYDSYGRLLTVSLTGVPPNPDTVLRTYTRAQYRRGHGDRNVHLQYSGKVTGKRLRVVRQEKRRLQSAGGRPERHVDIQQRRQSRFHRIPR